LLIFRTLNTAFTNSQSMLIGMVSCYTC